MAKAKVVHKWILGVVSLSVSLLVAILFTAVPVLTCPVCKTTDRFLHGWKSEEPDKLIPKPCTACSEKKKITILKAMRLKTSKKTQSR